MFEIIICIRTIVYGFTVLDIKNQCIQTVANHQTFDKKFETTHFLGLVKTCTLEKTRIEY